MGTAVAGWMGTAVAGATGAQALTRSARAVSRLRVKTVLFIKKTSLEMCDILGLKIKDSKPLTVDRIEIEKLIDGRNEARKNRDFSKADQIRDELSKKGILLEDTPQGTRWMVKNA